MKLALVFLFLLTLESYSILSLILFKIKNCSIDIQKDSNIDIFIPNNLIIAQAIIESDWGRSCEKEIIFLHSGNQLKPLSEC